MHRLLLSGTPVQNNLGELWALVRFVCGQLHSKPRAGNGKGSSGGGGAGRGCVLGCIHTKTRKLLIIANQPCFVAGQLTTRGV